MGDAGTCNGADCLSGDATGSRCAEGEKKERDTQKTDADARAHTKHKRTRESTVRETHKKKRGSKQEKGAEGHCQAAHDLGARGRSQRKRLWRQTRHEDRAGERKSRAFSFVRVQRHTDGEGGEEKEKAEARNYKGPTRTQEERRSVHDQQVVTVGKGMKARRRKGAHAHKHTHRHKPTLAQKAE